MLRYTTIGEAFNDELGFVPVSVSAKRPRKSGGRCGRRGCRAGSVRSGHTGLVQQSNRLDGNALDQRQQDFHLSISLANGAASSRA
jgi:hypothetical protein